ncbi:restriction endonuclease subunit S [Paenibacillus jamilae]
MINELKPYGEYKRAKQEWLNIIPIHWKEAKSKRLFNEISIKNCPNEELLSATQNAGVIPRSMLKTRVVMPSGNLETFKLVQEGNFVISLRSFQGGLEYSKYRGIVSPAYNILEEKTNQNKMYYRYLFKCHDFIGELQRNVTGIRQGKNIDVNDFKEVILPIPTLYEQDRIVKYLDFQLAKINKFIKAKKKLILALKDQKQTVINQAVTKGINPNVKMKPSGIKWLGDIPDHWNIMRCKFLFNEVDERSEYGRETHLSMSQKYGLIPNERLDERRLLSENYIGAKVCQTDDLVLNRLKAHLGVFSLAPQHGLVSPDYTVLRPNTLIFPKFSEYALKSQVCRGELYTRVKGIVKGFWRLYTDDFYNIVLPLPSYQEQINIVTIIEAKFQAIDSIISKTQDEIDLITEYRTRLISDVVTGKVDVRNIVIAEVDIDDIDTDELDEDELNNEEAEYSEESEA